MCCVCMCISECACVHVCMFVRAIPVCVSVYLCVWCVCVCVCVFERVYGCSVTIILEENSISYLQWRRWSTIYENKRRGRNIPGGWHCATSRICFDVSEVSAVAVTWIYLSSHTMSSNFIWSVVIHYNFLHDLKLPLTIKRPLLLICSNIYILTYSMVQSPSWEANWFAASQEFPRISRNPKVHYRTHKRPPSVSILDQPNPVHIPTTHLLEIHPNIIYPSTPRSPQWSLPLRFPQQDPIHPLSSPIRATCPANLILLDFITRTTYI